MPKKTEKPVVTQPESAWTPEAKAAHYEKVDALVATAMKSFPTAGSSRDLALWLKQNSAAGYKNLLRAAFQAYGI